MSEGDGLYVSEGDVNLGTTRREIHGTVVFKAVKPKTRVIDGYFTTQDEDRAGEFFPSEWFRKAIEPGGNYYANPVLLYHHDAERIIGRADVKTLSIDAVGVRGDFHVSEDAAWEQIQRKELNCFSWFGFVYADEEYVDLVEVTATPVPVNPKALFEIKKKAIDLGLATENDFPMPRLVVKSIHLGSCLESSVAMSAVGRTTDAMMWRLGDVMEDGELALPDKVSKIKSMFDEAAAISLKVIEAILPDVQQVKVAVKAIRDTWGELPAAAPIAASPDTNTENEMDEETRKAISDSVGEAVTKALQPLITALTPAATAPAPAAIPLVPPATTPADPPAPPESRGDAVVASKAILDEAGVVALVDRMMERMGVPAQATKAIVQDPPAPADDKAAPKRKALIEHAAKLGYGHSGAEEEWGDVLRDALALEMTGNTYGELVAAEEE